MATKLSLDWNMASLVHSFPDSSPKRLSEEGIGPFHFQEEPKEVLKEFFKNGFPVDVYKDIKTGYARFGNFQSNNNLYDLQGMQIAINQFSAPHGLDVTGTIENFDYSQLPKFWTDERDLDPYKNIESLVQNNLVNKVPNNHPPQKQFPPEKRHQYHTVDYLKERDEMIHEDNLDPLKEYSLGQIIEYAQAVTENYSFGIEDLKYLHYNHKPSKNPANS